MGPFGIGQAIKRFEDVRLVRGGGRFHGDVNLPGQVHGVVVRSVHAHARILAIDVSAALRAPGVLAVFTGADLAEAGLGTMRTTLARTRPDGSPMFAPPHPGLVRDRVRCVGDPVAFLVAETLAQAEDAAELVRIEYEPLPSVTATAEAAQPGSPPVWDECPDNVSNVFETGDRAATDAAFARADRIVKRRYVITRVHAQYLEPRGALGVYDPGEDRYKAVRYIDGDTDRVAFGTGTMGSRSTVVGGSALWLAADKVIAKGKRIAAHLLEAAEADIVFGDGRFRVTGTDRAVTITEVARAAFQPTRLPPGLEPGLYETGTFVPKQDTWPNGCHVSEVEVDPESGSVTLVGYVVVDDVGTVVNPLTLAGQIHGGVAQGAGQALMEEVVYDRESGQLLTASFMEYAMPRADTLGDMVIGSNPVPTELNPLGAKGAGEAGTVGALPAVMNAVIDALAPLGVRHLDMPATPERVWQAIQDAKTAP